MMNIKNIFSLKYHPKLVTIMIDLTISSVSSANIIAPLLVLYVLYDFVPHIHLYVWLFLHFFLFISRVFLAKNLRHLLAIESDDVRKYIIFTCLCVISTALLYAVALWTALYYDIFDLHIFTVAVIVIALAAGSVTTLVSVFHVFVFYVTLSMLPLIAAMLYHGGELFNVFALLLVIFTSMILVSGYRQFKLLNNTISLEETFETIFEKSSDGIALIQNNRFKDCNEAIIKMFQYNSKEELLSSHLSNFMPEVQADGYSSVKKMLQMLKKAEKYGTHSFEWLHEKVNGEQFWSEIVLTKITLEGESLIHGIWRDITERKILEAEQEVSRKYIERLNESLESKVRLEVEKNRQKDKYMLQQSKLAQMGEMISMIAHQWRQPLAAISATSALIELKANMNTLDKETAQKKAQDISYFSQHLSKTIDDFRNFFKPNKAKSKTTYDEIVHSILGIIQLTLSNENIKLIEDLNCKDSFTTHTVELKQVILNLIKNAEEALLGNGVKDPTIKIVTYTEENNYILEVRDNAGGVPKDIIDNIFDPYFSTKKNKDGSGLGLYMSKTIIEEHCEGTLSVSNDKNGAIFKIVLSKIDIGV